MTLSLSSQIKEMVCQPQRLHLQYDWTARALTLIYYVVLSHIISQLRPGADLSRVVLPTFILEPRSMLERITKYVSAERFDTSRGG